MPGKLLSSYVMRSCNRRASVLPATARPSILQTNALKFTSRMVLTLLRLVRNKYCTCFAEKVADPRASDKLVPRTAVVRYEGGARPLNYAPPEPFKDVWARARRNRPQKSADASEHAGGPLRSPSYSMSSIPSTTRSRRVRRSCNRRMTA